MSDSTPLVDLAPIARLALLGALLAALPLLWLGWRQRQAAPAVRLRALTLCILFLTFDLVVFGSFTRLTDSGLGCPDWPGCYGSVSPLGARDEIHAAQTALPTGPVTHGKAWIEMIHRYLATAVGALITVMVVASFIAWRRRGERGDPRPADGVRLLHPGWAVATWIWVVAQGAFGALTVTLKLYPAIVTLHLLGGVGLLALLAWQAQRQAPRPLAVDPGTRRLAWIGAAMLVVQIALGGWVSTNYAVLACTDFPTCQGEWWPPMDLRAGFEVLRPLGESGQGGYLPFEALTAIHVVHRVGAVALTGIVLLLAWRLVHVGSSGRGWAGSLVGLLAWQIVSGLSNVVLGWPLIAALAHSAGAAAFVILWTVLLARLSAASVARDLPVEGAEPAWPHPPRTPLQAAPTAAARRP